MILDRPSTTDVDLFYRAELLQRATQLVPLLSANAAKTERQRHIAQENIAALEQAGIFRMMQPKRFGGYEVNLRTHLEVIRELARGCGSSSWATALMCTSAWMVGLANEQAQTDVWGENPANRVACVVAPTATAQSVDDGYLVTGRWAFASGCLHAQWALLGVPVQAADGEVADQGMVLIPMVDLVIEDTWFVDGMQGTGSNTLSAQDVFVPSHRYVSVMKLLGGATDAPYDDEVLYRSAFVPVAALILAGPQLGLARAALDLVVESAVRRPMAYTVYERQSDAPVVQLAVGRAASLVDCAEMLAYRAAAEIDEAALRGARPTYAERARTRMDTGQSVAYAREAIRELVTAHGAGSFAQSNPLSRIWRDSETASRHAVVSPHISTHVYGRALLGFTDGVTPLV